MLAQLPGADTAIRSAAESGWPEVLLVILVLALVSATIYFARQAVAKANERERVLDERNEGHTATLTELVKANTEAMWSICRAQDSMNVAFGKMDSTLNEFNGDIKRLCDLMKFCPCLLLGTNRGKYYIENGRLYTASGDEVVLNDDQRQSGPETKKA